MKQSSRLHFRCRLSLERLELRLPPGAILFGTSLSITGLDWYQPTRPESLTTLDLPGNVVVPGKVADLLQGGVAGAEASKPRFGGEQTEPAPDVFHPVPETWASLSLVMVDGVSPMAWSADRIGWNPAINSERAAAMWLGLGILAGQVTPGQGPALRNDWAASPDTAGIGHGLAEALLSSNRTLAVSEQSPLAFDPASGRLAIWGQHGGERIGEAITPGGFVEVKFGSQLHSSNPTSHWFDPALSGASRETLAGIHIEAASPQAPVALGSQTLARGLTVQTDGPVDITGAVQAQGPVAIAAETIAVHGSLQGNAVDLVSPGLVNIAAKGTVTAARIGVTAGVFIDAGQLQADGLHGGQVSIDAGNILQGGRIAAVGTAADGGSVQIGFHESYIATAAALTSADGVHGGQVIIDGGTTGRLFSSGTQEAVGRSSVGGTVSLNGGEVVLVGATADASGQAGGGAVSIGSGLPAQAVTVNAARLRGQVMVESAGGTPAPSAGFHLIDPHPTRAGAFGFTITPLSNGNLVVTDPHDNFVAPDSGAVYLVQGRTGALLGSLVGSTTGDRVGDAGDPGGDGPLGPAQSGPVGEGVVVLTNGNYVVRSPSWSGNRGAVTWGDGMTGVTGVVDASNSLVGSNANDRVGSDPPFTSGVTALSNGNYVVGSTYWNGLRGAATWGDGTVGVRGTIDAGNSLVGSNPGDYVGSVGVGVLSNGNYVVGSPDWNRHRGAATWADGAVGITGTVDASNSLVGSNPGDFVGFDGITALSNGNYVVRSPFWNGGGAATWADGAVGITGTVDSNNSLVGSNPGDRVGADLTALSNGNYVVISVGWNGLRGAATWGNGTIGITGTVDASNSLVGSNPGDYVDVGVKVLSNGNYVVGSPHWNGNRGAATWGDGTVGVRGTIDAGNSLVGSNPGNGCLQEIPFGDCVGLGGITALSNGNYVVRSYYWNGSRGAATWGNGTVGVTGTVDASNSLVGSNPGDAVGIGDITALSNGNYVVGSPYWNSRRGAATWGDGTVGITGAVDAGNSLVGSNPNDYVGLKIWALTNGNYVVRSPSWKGNRGAATWGDGTVGITGAVDAGNSLVGSNPQDYLGPYIIALSNGNYVIRSPYWKGNRGAATWGDGTVGITGAVDAGNSLVGSNPGNGCNTPNSGDCVGSHGITVLSNGNYVVNSPEWNGGFTNGRGAATWGDGTIGVTGIVDASNSLIGSNPGDRVGSAGITALRNGNYVVRSPNWSDNRGAATWADGTVGITGAVDAGNSLVGSNPNDYVGGSSGSSGGGVIALSNGNYVVASPNWNGNRGAATWGDGTVGIRGKVNENNSLVG